MKSNICLWAALLIGLFAMSGLFVSGSDAQAAADARAMETAVLQCNQPAAALGVSDKAVCKIVKVSDGEISLECTIKRRPSTRTPAATPAPSSTRANTPVPTIAPTATAAPAPTATDSAYPPAPTDAGTYPEP